MHSKKNQIIFTSQMLTNMLMYDKTETTVVPSKCLSIETNIIYLIVYCLA